MSLLHLPILFLFLCNSQFSIAQQIASKESQGKFVVKTCLFNENGDTVFTHYLKVWYKENYIIEEIAGVTMNTDTTGVTTIQYPILNYKYFDPVDKKIYDYCCFSDTSKPVKSNILTDSLMEGPGLNFFSEKAPRIINKPQFISDTIVSNRVLKKAKTYFEWHNHAVEYIVAYFDCNPLNKYSLELFFSNSVNCNLIKYENYKYGAEKAYGSKEIIFLSSSLTVNETSVFDAWKKNIESMQIQGRQ